MFKPEIVLNLCKIEPTIFMQNAQHNEKLQLCKTGYAFPFRSLLSWIKLFITASTFTTALTVKRVSKDSSFYSSAWYPR